MARYWQYENSWVCHVLLSALSVPLPVLPAVGPLCDGACRKRIGGTFHTLGAAWWGFGSSLMNRVHLAESRGPQDSLVQTWFTDQSRVIPASPSHTPLVRQIPSWSPCTVSSTKLLILRSLLCLFDKLQNAPNETPYPLSCS